MITKTQSGLTQGSCIDNLEHALVLAEIPPIKGGIDALVLADALADALA
jgi:hypothetical protein